MSKRIDQLNFTRFIAALMVLSFHGGGGIYFQAVAIPPLSSVLSSAEMAVSYLYVLSGFVMSLAHYRPEEKQSLEEYWKARLIRLYPLYLAAFFLTCYYYGLGPLKARTEEALAHLLMAQAWIPDYALSYNFPAWSVSVEIFFYLLFPAFAWFAARQPVKRLIVLSLAAWAALQTVHHALWIGFYPQWQTFLIYFPLFHLGSFLLGAAAGIWYLREGRGRTYAPRVTLPLLLLGFLAAALYVTVSARVVSIPREGQLMAGLLSPFLTLVILALSFDASRLAAFFKRPALMALGEISYAFYIFHVPLRWIYRRALEGLPLEDSAAVFDFTYLPLLLAFSFLATFYFDHPLRARLKRILQNVHLPMLAFDLILLSLSVYYSFYFRFGDMRIRSEHYTTYRLMFWSAFVFRPLFGTIFRSLDPSIFFRSPLRFVQPVFLSVTAASAAMALVLYAGYAWGWVKYFPPSVLALDWAATLALSFLLRFIFGRAWLSRQAV